VKQFVDFATRTTKCFKQIICIAHNIRCVSYFKVQKTEITEEVSRVILSGTKIVVMVGHTKFIYSINYIPMHLSDLPKVFGLRDTSGKGTFPYLFNTKKSIIYQTSIQCDYSPEQMKPDRKRFLSYYEEIMYKNAFFDFQRNNSILS